MFRRLPRAGRSGRSGIEGSVTQGIWPAIEGLEKRVLLTVPLPPTGVSAAGASATSISINWDASADPSVTSYDIYERVHHVIHQPKGSPRSYDTYDMRGANLPLTNDTIGGLV